MLRAYLKLVRWPNLIMIGLILLLARTQLVTPLSELVRIDTCLSDLHWWLLGMTTVFIAASGNVVNDIFDQDMDRHNRPSERIIGVVLTEANAWNFYYVLCAIGLAISAFLCWTLEDISKALLFLLSAGGLYFYSYSYKRQFLIGNMVVSLLAALVPLLPLYVEAFCNPLEWTELPWTPVLVALAFFAFLTTLIREIIKDMQDVDGDRRTGCRTLPIVLGQFWTKVVTVLLLTALVMAIGNLQVLWREERAWGLFLYFLFAVQLPAIIVMIQVIGGQDSKAFHRASTMTKVLMLGGILSTVVYNTTQL